MDELVSSWLDWLTLKRSAATVAAYAWDVRRLLADFPSKRKPSQFRTFELAAWLADRRRAGCGDAATKRAVCAFRSFFGWALGDRSPARALPMPAVRAKRQRTLTADQAMAVLSSCDTSTGRGVRDLALMAFMLDTGVRASEVCRLRLSEVDLDRRVFFVVVKGGDVAQGVFSNYTAVQLSAWLSVRPEVAGQARDLPVLFLSMRGKALAPWGLRMIFRRVGQAAGLAAFSPHDLRRTFATLAILNGAPTRVVQVAGRWNDITLVERYTLALLASDFERFSPVERLMSSQER